MSDRKRIARAILAQNGVTSQSNISVLRFDTNGWLYWINELGFEEKDKLDTDPIYVNESVIGFSRIGTAVI